jgi:CheY-like chemotaxis protein
VEIATARVTVSVGFNRMKESSMVSRNILIVEDDEAVAASYQHILKRSLEYNYRIKSVTSAEDALESVKKAGTFDVVLLDFYLPGITGGEFLRALRTRDQETVVIVISSSQDYKIVHDVFKLGADDYLTKDELTNSYVLEKAILAGLEKKEYQRAMARNEVVRQRMDAITTIIRTVHHELNNPMAIIDLTLSKLASSPELKDPVVKVQLKEIQDNVDRMSDVLRKLLNLRDEMYNEGLRGLKLFAVPDKGSSGKNQE